jgi:uncharacterized protein (DUF362 family)/ferredoxin
MEPVVALQACADYERSAVEAAVKAAFESLGGIERWVKPGDRVFLKVNMLMPASPEEAITTHPEIVRAVAREVKRAGGKVMVGDNPAMARPAASMRGCGVQAVVDEEGLEAPDMAVTGELSSPQAKAFKSFEITKAALDADVLIGLSKLKTHSLAYMTASMKNLFGLIHGTEKARWHARAPEAHVFSSMLVDLYSGVIGRFSGERRMLNLCDGILAMEGEGPGHSGKPRKLGAVLASTDAVALDRVACAITGLDPERVLAMKEAAARGLGEAELSKIRVVGESIEHWAGTAFVPAAAGFGTSGLAQRLSQLTWVRNRLVEHPLLNPDACRGCRKCAEICPGKAIHFDDAKGSKPRFGLDRCIRCYCCAEICPAGALRKSATPWLGRLLSND